MTRKLSVYPPCPAPLPLAVSFLCSSSLIFLVAPAIVPHIYHHQRPPPPSLTLLHPVLLPLQFPSLGCCAGCNSGVITYGTGHT